MKIKFWILAMTLVLTAMAQAATNDLTGLLQKGLFDEEANRDLNAAIADYQSVAGAFDKDRQLAATAIFRLGECYRKLGKNNEATVQYQRIIKEFSDQPTLVTLSRQNLAGLNVSPTSPAIFPGEPQVREMEANLVLLKSQLQEVEKLSQDEARVYVQQNFPNMMLTELMSELNLAQQSLIKLKSDYAPDNPKYKTAQELVDDLNAKIDAQTEGVKRSLQTKLDAQTVYLETVKGNAQTADSTQSGRSVLLRLQIQTANEHLVDEENHLQDLLRTFLPTNPRVVDLTKQIEATKANIARLSSETGQPSAIAAEGANPVTDEEQIQIRNIQAMIQNSPDLINAAGGEGVGKTPLITAAEKGQLIVAKYLLDHGADVNGLSRNHGEVPLTAAAGNGHKAMVELLLARGADVSGGGLNPLYEAASRGFVSVVEVLLANKADVNLRSGTDTSGMRPVHVAARDGRTEMLQLLIKHGADVNVTDAQGRSPLELAAMQNEIATAKILLAAKAEVDARDKVSETPMLAEIRWNGGDKAEMVSLLLDGGAKMDAANNGGATPLLIAVQGGAVETARVLLAHKADPNRMGGTVVDNQFGQYSPVFLAIPHPEILKLLLDAGGKPTDLSSAIDQGQVDSIRLLLEHGADPNLSVNGPLPLARAIKNPKSKAAIPLLLDKGADPNAKDANNYAPLFLTSDPEIGRWLVEHKADVNARLPGGATGLMYGNSTNYIRFLLEAGAKIDLQDTNGNTALHHWVIAGWPSMIALLLEYKANPNIQNELGFTPLDLAKTGETGQIRSGMFVGNDGSYNANVDNQKKIADLLIQAGGLADLPKRNRIQVSRASSPGVFFTKGSHDWNRYSLLELIADSYGIISQNTSGEWGTARHARPNLFSDGFRFPDFKNVVIYRRMDASAKETAINVNLEEILKTADCSRDVWLEWGDVVEVPEADHPVDQKWRGLSDPEVTALTNCVTRRVTLRIKGEDTALTLAPNFFQTPSMLTPSEYEWSLTHPSFMLRSALDNSKLIRVSSDLTRVKVTRVDPQTKKKQEWVIDCTKFNQADLWLRDGDVIEVPEK